MSGGLSGPAVPLGRIGRPEDIANAVLYLASNTAEPRYVRPTLPISRTVKARSGVTWTSNN
jgi:NAD(P)-dependent dehydrogenase (short-subunit alcohol dehydrogenase family)